MTREMRMPVPPHVLGVSKRITSPNFGTYRPPVWVAVTLLPALMVGSMTPFGTPYCFLPAMRSTRPHPVIIGIIKAAHRTYDT